MFRQLLRSTRQVSPARRPRRSFRPALEAFEDRCLPSTFTWFQPVDGNFNDASKWHDQNNANGVPGPNDTASIPGGNYTVTVSAANTVNTFTSGGTLHFATGGSLTVRNVNPLASNSSAISGLILDPGTTLQLTGGFTRISSSTLAGTLNVAAGATLDFLHEDNDLNAGINLTGTGLYLITGDVFGGPRVHVNTNITAPANMQLDNGILDGPATLTVSGTTFNWTGGTFGGTGVTNVLAGAILNVSGSNGKGIDTRTVNVAGTMNWTGTGTIGPANGGTLTIQPGGVFNIQNDTNIGAFGTVNNAGTINKTSPVGTGITFVDSPLNNTGTINVQTGRLQLDRGGTDTGSFNVAAAGSLEFVGGTHVFNGGTALNGPGPVVLANGEIQANANVAVANFVQSGGTLDGTGTVTATGTYTWSGGGMGGTGVSNVAANATLTLNTSNTKDLGNSRTLNNAGTLNWTGGGFNVSVSATLNNQAGATWAIQSDNTMGGTSVVNNAGTLIKTSPVGTGATGFDVVFNNTGTVSVQSGVLQLGRGGTDSGTFATAAGGQLQFTGGTHTLNAGATFTGAGAARVNGNVGVEVVGAVTAATLGVDNGELRGTGVLTVTGVLDLTGGALVGSNGTVNLPAGSTLNLHGTGQKNLNGRTLNLAGTANWTDAGNFVLAGGAAINVLAGGVLNIQNDKILDGSGTFTNAGTVTKTAGPGTTTVSSNIAFNNNGTVNVQSGTLKFDGNYTQTGGSTNVAAGATLGAGSVAIQGGSLTGSGTVAADVTNAGQVSPGGAGTGTLTVTGKYTQSAAGALNIDLGGTAAGQFDQLAVGGAATLGGTLNLALVNGFAPSSGNTFQVVKYASSTGAFATTNGQNAGNGLGLTPTQGSTDVTVTATAAGLQPVLQFVSHLYQDLLGRTGSASEVMGWANLVAAGLDRGFVVQGFLNSIEYKVHLVQQAYQSLLGRAADVGGLNFFVGALNAGATPENVEAAIAGSPEFLQNNGGTADGFLGALYQTALGRTLDAAGQQFFGGLLAIGASRTQVADLIFGSAEAHARDLQGFYQTLLHRAPDDGGLAFFQAAYQAGAKDADVLALLLNSGEYFNRS